MIDRIGRAVAVTAVAGLLVGLAALPALAHERRAQGDLEIVVGFGTEPAYAGVPNSVQVILVHDGEPVTDLGNTLDVEVAFGDQTQPFELEPFFGPGFGTPGDYRAWFIPTDPGSYSFHLHGTVDGEEVDQTFTSGPDTFGDVVDPAGIQFPTSDVPTAAELADRIERVEPRLTSAIDDAASQADRAAADASTASDDAAGAWTVGMIGIAVGIMGLAVAIVALVGSRRRSA
jgi:hypothetical protein